MTYDLLVVGSYVIRELWDGEAMFELGDFDNVCIWDWRV